ncbi:hypothetical protein DFA_12131 [Cavenderia fasciculata]|uniref:Ankyrin repeat-containing protein n=1 Tax=Cavenderia fasciculata TaxID=261658 RepID=F4QC78_CACFS|nr:uncharacterized protein DFA_12131 [Cavenderia fasciculata]EGG14359.1 hypothetical protein DFA_12131 [Cavenderia fasciculata]|eukprot:XP_004351081.1 hypothetical protein DFA_12131 [Cavenderia fasciculata]
MDKQYRFQLFKSIILNRYLFNNIKSFIKEIHKGGGIKYQYASCGFIERRKDIYLLLDKMRASKNFCISQSLVEMFLRHVKCPKQLEYVCKEAEQILQCNNTSVIKWFCQRTPDTFTEKEKECFVVLHERGYRDPTSFMFACSTNDVDFIRWVHQSYQDTEISTKNIIQLLARQSTLEVIKLVYEYTLNGKLLILETITTTATADEKKSAIESIPFSNMTPTKLEIVKFLHQQWNQKCTPNALRRAAKENDIESLCYIHKNLYHVKPGQDLFGSETLSIAAKQGYDKVFGRLLELDLVNARQYIKTKGIKCKTVEIINIVNALEGCDDSFFVPTLRWAAKTGSLDLIKHIESIGHLENVVRCNRLCDSIVTLASLFGHLDVLQYLYQFNNEINLQETAKSENIELVKWALSTMTNIDGDELANYCQRAIASNQIPTLDYIARQFGTRFSLPLCSIGHQTCPEIKQSTAVYILEDPFGSTYYRLVSLTPVINWHISPLVFKHFEYDSSHISHYFYKLLWEGNLQDAENLLEIALKNKLYTNPSSICHLLANPKAHDIVKLYRFMETLFRRMGQDIGKDANSINSYIGNPNTPLDEILLVIEEFHKKKEARHVLSIDLRSLLDKSLVAFETIWDMSYASKDPDLDFVNVQRRSTEKVFYQIKNL